ncbi:DUF2169 domain-containing protein [Vibrio sp. ZSDE26]|uniref:DUF2169 domain-containing protein n=1 Tax=Vibrio amylolyticus TaxID=2847292 RepID=A0A9X1XIB6_9VIBR|nr:DUF2169 domain-containing protein [Vibrio amylolyticus]MCK6263552.1 DUF2169 domain-containing protein [Vibrio amylolyticus]
MQLWDIEANDNLKIHGCFQRDKEGNEVWVVTVKRGWDWVENQWVETVETSIADTPVYLDEPGRSAMKIDHDFPILKRNTDVIVYGRARSYAKKPVTYHECRLLVDEHIDKTLTVFGDRKWVEHSGSLTVTATQPFIDKAIDYSHAFGGDERNRLGKGVGTSIKELTGMNVPSVFYSKEDWSTSSKAIRVAGFGPLPPFFADRYMHAGTYDENWIENRRPLLPEDFDDRYYQCAPKDQQCNGHLKGGERMMLSGFCHNDTMIFRVPEERYIAVAAFNKKERSLEMPINTVFIDAEEKQITITYTAAFSCQSKEHLLTTTAVEKIKK